MRSYIEQQWGWDEYEQRKMFSTHLPVEKFNILMNESSPVAAWLLREETDLHLDMLLVSQAHQLQGIGRHIIEQTKQLAIELDKNIQLNVIKTNPVTGFYQKMGFSKRESKSDKHELWWEPETRQI